jgi:hypothetical protein
MLKFHQLLGDNTPFNKTHSLSWSLSWSWNTFLFPKAKPFLVQSVRKMNTFSKWNHYRISLLTTTATGLAVSHSNLFPGLLHSDSRMTEVEAENGNNKRPDLSASC